jgi:L-alanine-DL-glutamate epimerase-like enolase superfamily enzyme
MTPAGPVATRISSAEARVVRLPMGRHIPSAGGLRELILVVVKIRDQDGAQGHSFLFGLNDRHARLQLEALRYFAPTIVRGPFDGRGAGSAELEREIGFFGPGVLNMGAAAFRMAGVDLMCRRLGVSLSGFLGRHYNRVPAYVTGLFPTSTVDGAADRASELYERGFRAFKLSIGNQSVAHDADRAAEFIRRVPQDVKVMVDAAQRWSVPEALEASARLTDLGLEWIEDPIDHRNTGGYRLLTERSATAIASGENLSKRRELTELTELGLRYVIIDLERIGGIAEWLSVATALAGGPCTVLSHLYPHVSLQLMASVEQPVLWVEYVTWFEQLIDYDLTIVDGSIEVPDTVGSGFSYEDSTLDRLAVSTWERLL